uniref:Uncharacterized protein n=1 Tax=Anguilla anguilla TaxID=7936 RepID=A0A0E9XXS6_ANGAN
MLVYSNYNKNPKKLLWHLFILFYI